MNQLITALPNTGDVASITDANELNNIMRTAAALVDLSSDFEKTTQVLKVRNHAMRRLGQMYLAIPTHRGSSTDSAELTRHQFLQDLELTGTDRLKIVSLAEMDGMVFEERETLDRDPLWEGTEYHDKVLRDRQRIKDALAAKKRETERERPIAPTPVREVDYTALQRTAVSKADQTFYDTFGTNVSAHIKSLSLIGNFEWIDSLNSNQKAELWDDCDEALNVLTSIQARCQS